MIIKLKDTKIAKEQTMLGGFANRINDAGIGSLDIHQNLTTQVLEKRELEKAIQILFMIF